ncbi:hypothetical protein TWF694_007339 [Orbilia ellipsospora]|uniref:F-box domain-containing protein n=1 Tax=Orbilia ellipsospora TaxID=2528407 RepID=A0AAV9XHI4_9PEZI
MKDLLTLPPELYLEIASYLSPQDICSLSQCSKTYREFLAPQMFDSLRVTHCRLKQLQKFQHISNLCRYVRHLKFTDSQTPKQLSKSAVTPYRLYFSTISHFTNLTSLAFTYKIIPRIEHALFNAILSTLTDCKFHTNIKTLKFTTKLATNTLGQCPPSAGDLHYLGVDSVWEGSGNINVIDLTPEKATITTGCWAWDSDCCSRIQSSTGTCIYTFSSRAAKSLRILHLKVKEVIGKTRMSMFGTGSRKDVTPMMYENVTEVQITMHGFTRSHLWDIARRFPKLQKLRINEQRWGKAFEGTEDYLYTDIVGMKHLREVTLPWTTVVGDAHKYESWKTLERDIGWWVKAGCDNLKKVVFRKDVSFLQELENREVVEWKILRGVRQAGDVVLSRVGSTSLETM